MFSKRGGTDAAKEDLQGAEGHPGGRGLVVRQGEGGRQRLEGSGANGPDRSANPDRVDTPKREQQ